MGPITRTCSAIGLALALPALAEAGVAPQSLIDYARGRVADDPAAAVRYLSAALTAAPDDTTIALRAYRAAIVAGDYRLAVRGAQALDRAGALPPEGALLLLIAALRANDAGEIDAQLAAMARDRTIAFMVPPLRKWLVDAASGEPVTADGLAAENDLLAALSRTGASPTREQLRTLHTLDPERAQSLRLTLAATLAARGERETAAALLSDDRPLTNRARNQLAKRKPIGLAIDRPIAGVAFYLSRIAEDLDGAGRAAMTIARIAQFADGDNPRIALLVAKSLAGARHSALALAVVDPLRRDPVYGDDADSMRIDLLETLGRHDEAVAAADLRAGRSVDDAARMGDMALRRGDPAAAAQRYDSVLARAGDAAGWALWHAAGNAHLLAGDWARARVALETAHRLAPDQPMVLNSLGYGLVDVGGDPVRGKALIERAATLSPGNASIIDSQGWAAFRTGDLPRAIAALERARLLAPTQAEIGEHLGDVYWAAGRRIDARHAWEAARISADAATQTRLASKIERGLR